MKFKIQGALFCLDYVRLDKNVSMIDLFVQTQIVFWPRIMRMSGSVTELSCPVTLEDGKKLKVGTQP